MSRITEQQLKHNDCGISSAKILYDLHGIPVDREFIADNIFLSESGSSLQDIKQFFSDNGFETSFNLLDVHTLKSQPEKIKAMLPCIISVKSRSGLHFVVIKEIKNKKYVVIDPAHGQVIRWTHAELFNKVHLASVNYDLVSNSHVIDQLINTELFEYEIDRQKLSESPAMVMNKLTYFSYLKDNFGFLDSDSEKEFLLDLLFNQDINFLPKQFRSVKIKEEKLKLKVPVVLTVKKHQNIKTPNQEFYSHKNPYRRLYGEMKPYHRLWFMYITTAILVSFFSQFTLFKSQILIDHILPDKDLNLLLVFALGLFLFKIFNLLINIYKKYISIHLSNIFDNYFLTGFVEKLNFFPIHYIQTFSKGDLTERVKDSLKIKTFFIKFFTSVLLDTFVSLAALAFLFAIHWQATLVVILILSLFVVWFHVITPYIRSNENRRFLEKSRLFSLLFENIEGLQVIKSFRIELAFLQRVVPSIRSILNVQKRVRYVSLVNSVVVNLIVVTSTIGITYFLTRSSILYQTVSVGQIITFLAFTGQIFSAVKDLLEQSLDIQENEIILQRYFDFGNTEKHLPNQTKSGIYLEEINSIEFRNVGFHYIPQKPIFTDLNLKIEKGDRILLEGKNGAGKSTICKVLALLYDPHQGDVLINGEKSGYFRQGSLRKKILLISNEDIVFNDTLEYNINFDYDIDTSKALELAKELGFYEFINEKSEGFDFLVNEQGKNLSTGQRKKVLLMRAFMSNAQMIILDETLSGIDRVSREKIEKFINRQRDRTFIMISHEPLEHIEFNKTLSLSDGTIQQLQLQYS
ncbi:ABC transporter transmembrane domain-containing protein [Pararhodonellum marinum]|uniref:ABC transporter transmembrane domain-containing protein n=1 Tax=Pararhodonellum marinum TaxID=2755358 RepID=UPI00188EB9A4|nr:ABC transporter transmembrane domain-containing protein [Pararhodonellum marinum]